MSGPKNYKSSFPTSISEKISPSNPHGDDSNKMNKEKLHQQKVRDDLIQKQEQVFKEGELLTFIRVRFPGQARSFVYLLKKGQEFRYGERVLAMSERGLALGYINSFPYQLSFNHSMLPLLTIEKSAGNEELLTDQEFKEKEFEAKKLCESLIEKLKLVMEITHVEFTQLGKKVVFYFTSPERVDFRELVKLLVPKLKLRIELRQIHFRDRTAGLGGIGICGRQLCCCSFQNKHPHVSMKMAKNQNITLTPNKLGGLCGQLKCCLQFEDEAYQELKLKLPAIGSIIEAVNGDIGRVERQHILSGQFEMVTTEGIRKRYGAHLYDPNRPIPNKEIDAHHFDYIRDETFHLIT